MSFRSASAERSVVIDSIGTANPQYRVRQSEAAEFMLRTVGMSESLRKRIPQIYERSGIDTRYTCLRDYTKEWHDFDFYPNSPSLSPSPTTKDRNNVYSSEALELATKAAQNAVLEAEISYGQVTHLIAVSCTGFSAPGIDIHLVKRLGLSSSTSRIVIGFMGCYAAFNALKMASAICQSDSNAVVLIVCVELCTLHFQVEDTLGSVIVNALFSDGSAAAVVRSKSASELSGKLIYRAGMTELCEDSLDAMSWDIGDTGFIMGLSANVPDLIANDLPNYVSRLATKIHWARDEFDFWAVHPGGRLVLDRTASTLQLPSDALDDSYAVLREYGNMSSPTILFILKRIMERQSTANLGKGLAMAFGPGLTIEGALFEFGK